MNAGDFMKEYIQAQNCHQWFESIVLTFKIFLFYLKLIVSTLYFILKLLMVQTKKLI